MRWKSIKSELEVAKIGGGAGDKREKRQDRLKSTTYFECDVVTMLDVVGSAGINLNICLHIHLLSVLVNTNKVNTISTEWSNTKNRIKLDPFYCI